LGIRRFQPPLESKFACDWCYHRPFDIIVLGTVITQTKGGFLAGNTPEERAELTYNTQILISTNKLLIIKSL
jgi:hypothetical protein